MTRLLVSIFGAFIGLGVWIVGLTVTGHPIVERFGRRATARFRAKGTAVARGIVVGAGAAAVTRWWALLPLVVVGTMMFSGRFARHTTASGMEVGEAVGVWAERLRDTIRSGAGLETAVEASARTTPEVIGGPVRRLASRARQDRLAGALAEFADELAHPAADAVALALAVAQVQGGAGLLALIDAQIDIVRHENAVQREEDALRARYRTGTQIVLGAFATTAIGFRFFGNGFFDPYNSTSGQVALLLIGVVVLAGMAGLVALSRGTTRRRCFPGDAIRRAGARNLAGGRA